jgi:hypothetical protein
VDTIGQEVKMAVAQRFLAKYFADGEIILYICTPKIAE